MATSLPLYPLPRPVGGLGFTVNAAEALKADGWGGVQRTLAGALRLLDGAHSGDAVAWCGLIEGTDPQGRAGRLLAIVLTWSTDAVDEAALAPLPRAMAAGLGVEVRVEGAQAPQDGFFPTVAVLGGTLHRVRLPQEPEPVAVWAGPGPEGRVALFGGEPPVDAGWLDAPEVVLARTEDEEPAIDRDEALFLVHAASRLARVTEPGPIVRWMQRRLGPILEEEGLLTDDGRIDTEAVREAVTDAIEALKTRPPEARQQVIHRLGEPLASQGGFGEAEAKELAMAMAALGLIDPSKRG